MKVLYLFQSQNYVHYQMFDVYFFCGVNLCIAMSQHELILEN